jgi:hypothetical protein
MMVLVLNNYFKENILIKIVFCSRINCTNSYFNDIKNA